MVSIMEAWLILISIAAILINKTTKLSYAASAWSPTHINPMQNNQFPNFADSPSFGLLYKKVNGGKIYPIFGNSTLFQMTKSDSLCIKLSPDEPFIKIVGIFRLLGAHECTIQKKRGMNQKMASQIMGIID
eukprot:82313_1